MSLRDLLKSTVLSKGTLSYAEMVSLVMEEGYKISVGERRLRGLCGLKNERGEAQTPEIEPYEAKSKRGTKYTAGWRRKETVQSVSEKYYKEFFEESSRITINGQSIPIFAEKKQTREKAGKLF